ncbi:MAG TPA: DoxX family protein [Chloroflexota bacterium]|nr:DoxX family protein [Chloroflexota bacterium]
MIGRLIQTDRSYALLVLRVALAIMIFPHGAQKLLGWYGGAGFDGTMLFFATLGVPAVIALLVIVSDFFGSLALAVGFLGRVAAFGTTMVMLGAMVLVHGQYGFFLNWNGDQAGEGVQFHLLVLAVAVVLMVKGSGAWSVDRLLVRVPTQAAIKADPGRERLRAA